MDHALRTKLGRIHGKVPESCANVNDVSIWAKGIDQQVVLVDAGFFDDPDIHGPPNHELKPTITNANNSWHQAMTSRENGLYLYRLFKFRQ